MVDLSISSHDDLSRRLSERQVSDAPVPATTTPFLVFGYGSLIWRPPPHVARRIPGYITTHYRRFWQLSEDHRGTVERPGRVVTLVPKERYHAIVNSLDKDSTDTPSAGTALDSQTREGQETEIERCWGVVYEIHPESVQEVQEYLTVREINGYSCLSLPVHTSQGILSSSVYIGTLDNPQFSAVPDTPQGLLQVARHIKASHGPSGPNEEYLLNLGSALHGLQVEDAKHNGTSYDAGGGCGDWYVEELIRLVRTL